MTELFYFSSLDLMLKVEYLRATNSLRYTSHREMEYNERVSVEFYIMAQVAPKTDYYFKRHSKLVYLGIDARLEKRLAQYQQKKDLQLLTKKDEEITASVNGLINVSMRDYYSEKIGELIMSARSELQGGRRYEAQRANLKRQMNDLLDAYNVYADQKVTLDEIIPSELKPYWPGLEETRWYALSSQ